MISMASPDGFSMPAEYWQHSHTLMLWPERNDIWRNGAKPIQKTIVELSRVVSEFEPVIVGVTAQQYMHARNMLPSCVKLFEISYNDIWIRDIAPTFLVNNECIRGVDWKFNAWGGCEDGLYYPWDLDDSLAQKLLELYDFPRYAADMVLEGGAIATDGEGTLIATEQCLLNKNRNPSLSKNDIEYRLKTYLNITKVIWLKSGLMFDEAGGHIDNLCTFARPGEVLLAWTNDKNHPQYPICQNAFNVLAKAKDALDRPLKIERIELPETMRFTAEETAGLDYSPYTIRRSTDGSLLGSYINFVHVNGGVIIPTFGCEQDAAALEQFKALFPAKQIVQVSAREIILGGGGLHCVTKEVPPKAKFSLA